MWVVYVENRPTYWLLCGETYTVGKKDAHIVVANDSSVSRTHLLIRVAQSEPAEALAASQRPPLPPGIVLTDTSTYGTVVIYAIGGGGGSTNAPKPDCVSVAGDSAEGQNDCSEAVVAVGAVHEVPLQKGETHDVCVAWALRDLSHRHHGPPPSVGDARRGQPSLAGPGGTAGFRVVLGTHGATLELRWEPLRVFDGGVDAEYATKLGAHLSKCGAEWAPDVDHADVLVVSSLSPSPAIMGMLCRGGFIVSPAYFARICARDRPQLPLPDAASPSLLPRLEREWAALFESQQGDADARRVLDAVATLLSPTPGRRLLFSGLVFVMVQPQLHVALGPAIHAADGRSVLDNTLQDSTAEDDTLAAFFDTHRRHVLLLDRRQPLPGGRCIRRLQDEWNMCFLEYLDLVRSVLAAEPPVLSPFRSTPQRARSPVGRVTDPNPIFPDEANDAAGEHVGRSRPVAVDRGMSEVVMVDRGGGWRGVDDGAEPPSSAEPSRGAKPEGNGGRTPASKVFALPAYPCFYGYTGGLGGKRFLKQRILESPGSFITLEEVAPRPPGPAPAANLAAERHIEAIDSDAIIPEVLDDPASRNAAFNAFDVSAFHAIKKRGPVKGRRGGRAAVPAECARGAPLIHGPVQSAAPTAAPGGPSSATMAERRRGSAAAAVVDVFDIDALF